MPLPSETKRKKTEARTGADRSPVTDPFLMFVPEELRELGDIQRSIPRLAKDQEIVRRIEDSVGEIPTRHRFVGGDARFLSGIADESVHLIVTSPPYWTLKEYRNSPGQLGHISDYQDFLDAITEVWDRCHQVLVPGGRLICVVGDVCLSRRKNEGRHTVVPLHASIQEQCRLLGFDNLAPIIWHKISNAAYEVAGNSSFLGKPYEPNAVIKNDIEFILMQRKPGGYRQPTTSTRILSLISELNHKQWFQQIWTGLPGASTRKHPAPYPVELAERLIRMFSFVGDTVLDPFLGTGSTSIAAARWGRNSIGFEIDPHYLKLARQNFMAACDSLFSKPDLMIEGG